MKSKLKNFSLLTISTLIMAVGIYFFKFANNFTFGGITGIAVLVAKFLPISASDFSFVVNILLLIIGWIVLGKSFAEKTAYSTILLSVSLSPHIIKCFLLKIQGFPTFLISVNKPQL